jgi:hypothetical protein
MLYWPEKTQSELRAGTYFTTAVGCYQTGIYRKNVVIVERF